MCSTQRAKCATLAVTPQPTSSGDPFPACCEWRTSNVMDGTRGRAARDCETVARALARQTTVACEGSGVSAFAGRPGRPVLYSSYFDPEEGERP